MASASTPGEPPEAPRHLQPAAPEPSAPTPAVSGGGDGPDYAGRIVDSLKASADQEFQIAERLSTKARHAFALAAGVFVVAQTVAFGGFEARNLHGGEKRWMIALAAGAVFALLVAAISTMKADDVQPSGDLPLDKLEDDLNAAYEGDGEVVGRLGGYYLGIVCSRRKANTRRRAAYATARHLVGLSLFLTTVELLVSLIARVE